MTASTAAPIVLTPGEPGGIGTEITIKAWRTLRSAGGTPFAVLADIDHVKAVAAKAALAVEVACVENIRDAASVYAHKLPILHCPLPAPARLGTASPATASWVTSCIQQAVVLCLSGAAAALVTNPIQKQSLYEAGFKHQGHTDFLASLCRERGLAAQDVMMLVGGGLRTVPVTVHVALKDVPAKLTQASIETQAEVLHQSLRKYFGITRPRIAVAGLNPHAGENGSIGQEEIEIIRPAIANIKGKGINVFGPIPADTAFFPQARESYDAILCMYHDQALIPVKTLDFHGGVNVTLGLPFIRTSPDHGTALDLAGTGKAGAESLVAAITLAAQMAKA